MCNRNWNAGQQTEGDESLFAIREPVVLVGVRQPFEHARRVDEVEPVFLEAEGALALRPGKIHGRMYIRSVVASRSRSRRPIASSYCVVFDTVIEDMPAGMFPRPAGSKLARPSNILVGARAGHFKSFYCRPIIIPME